MWETQEGQSEKEKAREEEDVGQLELRVLHNSPPRSLRADGKPTHERWGL